MDFTSSSGVLDSERNTGSNDSDEPSSHSDVIETEELKLIKLQEHKNNLLRQRSELLDQLSQTRVVEPRSVQLDDKLLLKLLRRNDNAVSDSSQSSNNPLPRVLPSLNIEQRKKYLDITLNDVTVTCEKDMILLRKGSFTASFRIAVENESIRSMAIDLNAFEVELQPIIQYAEDTQNVNVAMMAVVQFLRIKELHEQMISKIVEASKFIRASNNTITLNDLEVSFHCYWNLPSPYPETLILTNKVQKILDFLIYQYGIQLGVIKYGSTII
ncbi:uncharacterized protein KLLA0_D07612g [Kluyveromyces lactis]|uniref:Inner kinetochore subunit CTF19 n=1 Tax=Kluyveromyces lactis (strain ATCC 8585 / CBS 2359 / DSM 70799 / NBRC 1267 / NRRL Y-1140 / WM37) TaxID=284590 RepID=CENPP_KLULA|nr:uncharacterized protein KLLA0_D07612g [Kluyveromyces lactis]Q6CRN7.1 RecName: Full=Inner kinetochore subunit CTF19; AltName: Full=CENP-P homolog; AltName: Full=Constitutive centromere-associated network protein CTF19 [Kluyveromyces lactis NRRL Y-1140]3ZXU_B Chain B, CTF19 [Kluyveromyces lactis NRRL Y-1140]3ZXU_D Chain D, CTF19 [Kluyveromyces lactis NRRL Y-1140]CAH00498.1 KLLA0D07612p [Kluyveromyces lactis]|eukprot:XP_453402.1 uncharacterized protein KLLA0_D07612g [Kluyveromyces lactis]